MSHLCVICSVFCALDASFVARLARTAYGSPHARRNRSSLSLFLWAWGLFRGVDDLRDGIIRTPLSPMITFQDDPLRVLRAVRFAARFGFTLHEVSPDYVCFSSKRSTVILVSLHASTTCVGGLFSRSCHKV